MAARHLTQEEKQRIAEIVGDDLSGAFEVLQTVAGLVANNVADFGAADESASQLRKAALHVRMTIAVAGTRAENPHGGWLEKDPTPNTLISILKNA